MWSLTADVWGRDIETVTEQTHEERDTPTHTCSESKLENEYRDFVAQFTEAVTEK